MRAVEALVLRVTGTGAALLVGVGACNAIIGIKEGIPDTAEDGGVAGAGNGGPGGAGDGGLGGTADGGLGGAADGGTQQKCPKVTCYGGPPEAAGVGACVEGVRACDADGNPTGDCVGDVLPTPEICGGPTLLDDDCDGVVNEMEGSGCACGDGALTDAEACDDGGVENGDGCSEICTIERVIRTAGGEAHACALFDTGIVKCWGYNNNGQLGLGDTVDRGDGPNEMAKMLPAVDLGKDDKGKYERAIAISAGWWHSCAILTGGRVKCWGSNYRGQLGLGHTNNMGDQGGEMGNALPVIDLGPGEQAETIVSGDYHNCVRLKGDNIKCWGHNDNGQLGLGDVNRRGDEAGEMGKSLPYVNIGMDKKVAAVTASGWHTCALLTDKAVKCWGWNERGQLGLGDTKERGSNSNEMGDNLPAVDLGGAQVSSVVAASHHTCAVLDGGALKCWGENKDGELGLGIVGNKGDAPGEMGDALPAVTLGPGMKVLALAGGEWHTCAIMSDNTVKTVKCWGWNAEGQLGLGDTATRGDSLNETVDKLPAVSLGAGMDPAAIASSDNSTCVVSSAGALKCWGENAVGELGLGDTKFRGDQKDEMGDFLPTVKLY